MEVYYNSRQFVHTLSGLDDTVHPTRMFLDRLHITVKTSHRHQPQPDSQIRDAFQYHLARRKGRQRMDASVMQNVQGPYLCMI